MRTMDRNSYSLASRAVASASPGYVAPAGAKEHRKREPGRDPLSSMALHAMFASGSVRSRARVQHRRVLQQCHEAMTVTLGEKYRAPVLAEPLRAGARHICLNGG
jgi:hypothetical protein